LRFFNRTKEVKGITLKRTNHASECIQGVGKDCLDYDVNGPVNPKNGQLCNGYLLVDNMVSQATWTAGKKQSIQIAVHATHRGGICQFGLSYDKGKTIKTIQTTKNCLIAAQEPADKFGDSEITQIFSVQLPADIPSGTALFSWSWFNTDGNREMYNSCSMVTINGGTVRTMPKTYKDIVILNVPNLEPTKKCVSIQGTVPDLTRLASCIGTVARSLN
jgi:hypothetical protein